MVLDTKTAVPRGGRFALRRDIQLCRTELE
ncbi:hypothetical protein SAMN04488568_1186 [Maricaulis salignorans]|uniref:Uncharacterized protein n=1 Tax=Maricaulis salignorans TaxID=144026 RepID=A0A1G9V6S4_9PROT|nr:hypothetical protein SAMN04488568_1186 [Maricaulis salignorans]